MPWQSADRSALRSASGRPESPRRRLVDDRHTALRARRRRETAPGSEESASAKIMADTILKPALNPRSGDGSGRPTMEARRQCCRRAEGRRRTRRPDAGQHESVEARRRRTGRGRCARRSGAAVKVSEREHVRRLEARVRRPQRDERFQQRAGASEQHERERGFEHESPAGGGGRCRWRRPLSQASLRRCRRSAGRAPNRTRGERDDEREEEDRAVGAGCVDPRDAKPSQYRGKSRAVQSAASGRPHRHDAISRLSALPYEAPGRREGGAHRELTLACRPRASISPATFA